MGEELLFRVWDNKNKHYRNDLTLRLDGYLVDEKGEVEDSSGELYCIFCDVQHAITLRDKNSKQIFLGDIVRDTITNLVSLILWRSDYAAFSLHNVRFLRTQLFGHLSRGIDVEIIGNINENPELLDEGK
jgi:hypothetical protein